MTNCIPRIIAISGSDIGIIISLVVIGGGLAWLLKQSIKAGDVDRRVVFLFIFISVSVPILFPITFSETATPIVKKLYDRIENLPDGSAVLISFDFDPAMAPEVQPMADAFARHCLAKNHKVIFMSLWATGQSLLSTTLQNVVRPEFPDKIEGVDFANLGYKAGNEGVLNVIVTNFRKMFPTDVNGIPLDSIAVFKKIRSCQDLDLIISIGGGKPGAKEWILFVGDPANVPMGCGVAAVTAPQLYPYYPKQLLGILGGIKGAAEYESELVRHYDRFADIKKPGLRMMGPQTLAHVVIMAFIVLGNISYFVTRRRGKKP
jgi:hypothetical protein